LITRILENPDEVDKIILAYGREKQIL